LAPGAGATIGIDGGGVKIYKAVDDAEIVRSFEGFEHLAHVVDLEATAEGGTYTETVSFTARQAAPRVTAGQYVVYAGNYMHAMLVISSVTTSSFGLAIGPIPLNPSLRFNNHTIDFTVG